MACMHELNLMETAPHDLTWVKTW